MIFLKTDVMKYPVYKPEITQKEKEFVGLGILIAGFFGILFSATLFAISFFVDNLLHAEIGDLLMFLAPFCFILPFQFFKQTLVIF